MKERLTEYHCGVPVIKDKRFGEAAAKLARYENTEQDHPCFKNLAEDLKTLICDKLCFYCKCSSSQSTLDECCSTCEVEKRLNEMVEKYTVIDTFAGSELEAAYEKLQEARLQAEIAENAVELLKRENLQIVALGERAELKRLEEYAAAQKALFSEAGASVIAGMIAGAADYAYYTSRISRDAWKDFNSVHVLNDNKK